MNHYGAQAQKHWRTFLPDRFAMLPDPNSFFSILGQEAATQIETRTLELAGPDQPGEGYLAKVGRLNQAKQAAEEEILPELILIDPGRADDLDLLEERVLDEPEDQPTTAGASWVPTVEDPTHPWWRRTAEEEADAEENETEDGPSPSPPPATM